MIIRLAGTSGSGKSTLVRALMEKRGAKPFLWPAVEGAKKPPKIRGYSFPYQGRSTPGLIVGRYNLRTGGADRAFNHKMPNAEGVIRNSIERLQDEIELFWNPPEERPCIIFEGLIVSSVWGRWVRLSQKHPEYNMTFAFMDTSLDTCRENVHKRNQGKPRGGDVERQDRNLISKYEGCVRQLEDCKGNGWKKWIKSPQEPVTERLDWRIIRYNHALEDLEAILDG